MTAVGPRTAAALIACLAGTLLLAPAARAVDDVPPSVPTRLMATAVSPTRVDLTWTAAFDAVGVTGCAVYRDGRLIATSTSTSFSDATVVYGTVYEYAVDAFDAAGNLSPQSVPVTVSTGAPVTVESVCRDLAAALKSSPRYPANKSAVDAAAARLCGIARAISPQLSDAQKRNLVAAFKALLSALWRSDWLTAQQAADLSAKADRLVSG